MDCYRRSARYCQAIFDSHCHDVREEVAHLRYEEIRPLSRYEAVLALGSTDPDTIVYGLLSAALYDDDWRWVQGECSRFAEHPDAAVRATAALGLGHLARIHQTLNQAEAEQTLAKLQADPDRYVAGRAADALDDLRTFLKRKRSTSEIDDILGTQWPLAWRLVDHPTVAREIRVLSETEDMDDRGWVLHHSPVAVDFRGHYVVRRQIDTLSGEEIAVFLLQLGADLQETCRMLWANGVCGVELLSGLAFRHFSDLWYPGSDEVWVINRGRTWVLECDHEGLVRFAVVGPPAGTDV